MSSHVPVKERAAIIRRELKHYGWTSRDVGVRISEYSMGASIYVTIRRADIALDAVEAICFDHRGENIFITVSLGWGAVNTYVSRHGMQVGNALADLLNLEDGQPAKLCDGVMIVNGQFPGDYTLRFSDHEEHLRVGGFSSGCIPEFICTTIGNVYADRDWRNSQRGNEFSAWPFVTYASDPRDSLPVAPQLSDLRKHLCEIVGPATIPPVI